MQLSLLYSSCNYLHVLFTKAYKKLDPSFIQGRLKELQMGIKTEESHIIKLNKEIDGQKKVILFRTVKLFLPFMRKKLH